MEGIKIDNKQHVIRQNTDRLFFCAAAADTLKYSVKTAVKSKKRNVKSKSLTVIMFSELCLQVLGVDVDEILLFRTFAFPTAETAAAETAAAGKNTAANHEGLNTERRQFVLFMSQQWLHLRL